MRAFRAYVILDLHHASVGRLTESGPIEKYGTLKDCIKLKQFAGWRLRSGCHEFP